ncbi:MAG: PQQ-binding-like beta-propeller repeat protein [Deltaproteobacteria bacterium]|nr:PQQ-binding-like beta-propeller repeat protein [Deltaproteobacteria bacterium]
MKKHIILWSVAFGLVAGALLTMLVVLTPVRRFPAGVVAGGDDDAILLTRFNDIALERYFVERIADGEGAWSIETSPLLPAEGFTTTAARVAVDRVALTGTDGQGVDFAFALALDDGRLLWRTALPGSGGADLSGRLAARVLVDDARAYVLHDVYGGAGFVVDRLDAVALDDGRLLWSLTDEDLGARRFDVLRRGADLVVTGAPARRVDPATGAITARLAYDTVLCEGARGLVGVSGNDLVWAPDGAPERRVAFDQDVDLAWSTTCGFVGDDVVIDLTRRFMPRLARVDLATGAVVWERALGLGTVMEGPVALGPALPRLLPIPMCAQDGGADGPTSCVVVVVDLESGTIVQRHRAERAEAARTITTPDRAWLWVRHAGLLVGLDPETGALTSALHMERFTELEPQVDDAAGLHLWLAPRLYAHPGELPWVVVDLASGAVAKTGGDVEVTSVPPRLGLGDLVPPAP